MVRRVAADPVKLTPEQQARENSILFAIVFDTLMLAALFLAGIMGGSLTMLAEGLRGLLGYILECFSFLLLRRIHRGVLADMEYGSGKIEQVANFLIGASMMLAAIWIAFGAASLLTGQRPLGTPLGLACAAIVGAVNLYVNVLAWDGVRRAAAVGGESIIMEAQLHLRWVKLCASLVVAVGLTVAALSTDKVIVAFADGMASLFVAAYLVVSSTKELRTSIPDLLDRSAGRAVQLAIYGALFEHADEYAAVGRSRTRRSGHVTFIEISLAFDCTLSIEEVDRRIEAFKHTIRQTVPDSEISVLASSTNLVFSP